MYRHKRGGTSGLRRPRIEAHDSAVVILLSSVCEQLRVSAGCDALEWQEAGARIADRICPNSFRVLLFGQRRIYEDLRLSVEVERCTLRIRFDIEDISNSGSYNLPGAHVTWERRAEQIGITDGNLPEQSIT